MKRAVVTVLATVGLAFLIVLPALGIQTDDSTSAGDEDTTITRYDADFRVAADGDLTVRETLTVDFPNPASTASSGSSTPTTRARNAPCGRRGTCRWRW